MDNSGVGIVIALGVSLFFLYTRKEKWMPSKIVWIICTVLFLIGIFGLLYLNVHLKKDKILYYGYCVPMIYWIFDRVFKHISYKIHNRDFILYLRGSFEINDGFGAKNPHVKESDMVFSFVLLFIVVMATLSITQIA